ncbi:hypothetical protein CRUP_017277 [Coryphaenoides rupestris]|nr:hypothetical protein CRUP_017277 [Coryphaenoides rupestris]
MLNSYQDAMQLGDLLRYNRTLQTLELSHNAIADAGLEELCAGLRLQTGGLKALLLRNNQITSDGMLHLAKALPVHRSLEVLDVGDNRLGNSGLQTLREPLMANRSLLHFGVACASITCEGAVAMAEYLAESPQIRRLDLQGNEVRVGGLMALCLALRINLSLATLDLDSTPQHEQGREQEPLTLQYNKSIGLSPRLSDEDITATVNPRRGDQLVPWPGPVLNKKAVGRGRHWRLCHGRGGHGWHQLLPLLLLPPPPVPTPPALARTPGSRGGGRAVLARGSAALDASCPRATVWVRHLNEAVAAPSQHLDICTSCPLAQPCARPCGHVL